MKIDPVVIREILLAIAKKKSRPDFENSFVRDVVEAFRVNKPHPYKQEVIAYYHENYSKEALPVGTVQMDSAFMAECQLRLKKACVSREVMRALSRNSGVDFRDISSLAKGRSQLTQQIWNKIKPELDYLENGNDKLTSEFNSSSELWG